MFVPCSGRPGGPLSWLPWGWGVPCPSEPRKGAVPCPSHPRDGGSPALVITPGDGGVPCPDHSGDGGSPVLVTPGDEEPLLQSPWGWGRPYPAHLRNGHPGERGGGSPDHVTPTLGDPLPQAQHHCWPGAHGWLGSSSLPCHPPPSTAPPQPACPCGLACRLPSSHPWPGALCRSPRLASPVLAPLGFWQPSLVPAAGCLFPFLASFLPRLLRVSVAQPLRSGPPSIPQGPLAVSHLKLALTNRSNPFQR